MIHVICSHETYIYNAYHMTKAFYPAWEVDSRVEEKASNYVEVQIEDTNEVLCVTDELLERYRKEKNWSSDNLDKKELKYQVDRVLYELLSKATKRTLAWGILMGVRPTKIAMQKICDGVKKEEFVPWFQDELCVSEEKADLAFEIAKREKKLLDQLDYEQGFSLYVGIPFCPSVCSYCSFSSGELSVWSHRVDDYVDALCKELSFIAESAKEYGRKVNTIYIGGGTPTTLSVVQLERLLSHIDTQFEKDQVIEYTVEAGRPDSITREKLEVIKKHGVSRISINPQTMQQKTLDAIGRKHTVQDIYDVYEMAREIGFENINMDLIAGLEGETLEDMQDTLCQIKRLMPDNLTVHALAIKRAAKMGQKDSKEYEKEQEKRKTVGPIEAMVRAAYQAAGEMGMEPYYLYRQKNIAGNFENVGYAKVDKAGIYNILIMEEKQSIIAAGAGASTKIVLKEPVAVPGNKNNKMTTLIRQENVKAIDAYIDRIDEMIKRKEEWLWH